MAAGLIAAASCARDEMSANGSQEKNMVEISFDASLDVQTKVQVGEKGENGYQVLWSPGDRLNIFPYDYADDEHMTGGYMFSTDIEQPSLNAIFSGKAYEADEYFAVYPYNSKHEWYPQEKKIRVRYFISDNGLSNNALMLAKAEDGKMRFKHMCGYVKFAVPKSVTDMVSVTFAASSRAAISARYVQIYPESMTIANVEMPSSSVTLRPYDADFFEPGPQYMAVLPCVLEHGFSLLFVNAQGLRYVKETSMTAEIVQGQILNLGEISDLRFDYPVSTVAQVAEGNDGEYYRVKGVVTEVVDAGLGNFYLSDETGTIYICRTLKGTSYYSPNGFEIAVGDSMTVQGPRRYYDTALELVDVSVVEHKKNIKLDWKSYDGVAFTAQGGEVSVGLIIHGESLDVMIPEDAQSWLSVTSVEWQSDTTATVTFNALENNRAYRATQVEFMTVKGSNPNYTHLTMEQESAVLEATAAEIAASEDCRQDYRLTGYVASILNTVYGNMYVKDYSGEIYIYGTYDLEGNRFDAFADPIREGDVITIEGVKDSYNGVPQMEEVKLVDHKHVKDLSVNEFLDAPVDNTVFYRLTGTVRNLREAANGIPDPYGKFDLIDDAGHSVYVHGLLTGWGGPSNEFLSLGIYEEDVVTIVGQRSQCDGIPCVEGAFYIVHDSQTKSGL